LFTFALRKVFFAFCAFVYVPAGIFGWGDAFMCCQMERIRAANAELGDEKAGIYHVLSENGRNQAGDEKCHHFEGLCRDNCRVFGYFSTHLYLNNYTFMQTCQTFDPCRFFTRRIPLFISKIFINQFYLSNLCRYIH
jgi:hypothetical protein